MAGKRNALWLPPFALGLAWGFAEATLFYVIPDIIIGWAALSGRRAGLKMIVAAITGAVVGGLLLYSFAARHPAEARAAVDAVPFVRAAMLETVAGDYSKDGPAAVLRGPGTGIPYKVYAVLAPPVTGPVSFALLSIPARLERFLPTWLIFTLLGHFFRHWIANNPRAAGLVFVGVWAIGYAVYWSVV